MPRLDAIRPSVQEQQRPAEATLERKTPRRPPRDTLETPPAPGKDDSSCLSLIPRCLWATIKGLFTCIFSCIVSCFHCLVSSSKKTEEDNLVASTLSPWLAHDSRYLANMPTPCKLTLGIKITYSNDQILALSFPEPFNTKDTSLYHQFFQIALRSAKEILARENIQPQRVETALLSCRTNEEGLIDLLLSQSTRGPGLHRVVTEGALEEGIENARLEELCALTPGLFGLSSDHVCDMGNIVVVEAD